MLEQLREPSPRRDFLKRVAVGTGVISTLESQRLVASSMVTTHSEEPAAKKSPKPTRFQLACMTLPYADFSWGRSLEGIRKAGFEYVAWGTTHRDAAQKKVPVIAADASLQTAADLGKQCRDLGLTPLMMFAGTYPEARDGLEVHTQRLKQAAAAKIPQLLTFGHTAGGNRAVWIERLKTLGPIAEDLGVMLVVKQHGGETGTGEACAAITREVNHPHIRVNYDAGNVLDYLNVDPLPDLAKCAVDVRSFCLKDHRNFPKDEDCAPGFGEIDHYRLLDQVAWMGIDMPLCFENIFVPLLPRPQNPEETDRHARRSLEYIQLVIAGLQRPREV